MSERTKRYFELGGVVILNALVSFGIASVLIDRFEIPEPEQKFVSTVLEERVPEIVEIANPAVLSITGTSERPPETYSPFLLEFFGIDPRDVDSEGRVAVSRGSGFIASENGLVITNRHVVADTTATFTGVSGSGEEYSLHVVARDPVFDIAVLQIVGTSTYPYLSFGDSEEVELGETVVAIGTALGEFQNSVSVGVVSGLSRSILAGDEIGGSIELLENVIQTDAAINPGNSGGPLMNLNGEVVGVNVAVAEGSENIGFAIPANAAQEAIESIETTGVIARAYLGVRFTMIDEEGQRGAYVVSDDFNEPAVAPGSPAEKAGIEEGDLIVTIDGIELGPKHTLSSVIRQKKVGEAIRVGLMRDGSALEVTATLEPFPAE